MTRLQDLPTAAQLVWTSAKKFDGTEFCSMVQYENVYVCEAFVHVPTPAMQESHINKSTHSHQVNELIRRDDPEHTIHVAIFARMINAMLVVSRSSVGGNISRRRVRHSSVCWCLCCNTRHDTVCLPIAVIQISPERNYLARHRLR